MSKLDQLLTSLRPEMTLDETSRRADEALNSFALATAMIHDWEEFTACIGRFLAHMEARMLRMGGPVRLDPSFHWSRCAQMLRNIYGPSGEKVAFEKARTGNEGGLYTVLKALALTAGEQCAGNEIRARIDHYWDRLSVSEQLAADLDEDLIRRRFDEPVDVVVRRFPYQADDPVTCEAFHRVVSDFVRQVYAEGLNKPTALTDPLREAPDLLFEVVDGLPELLVNAVGQARHECKPEVLFHNAWKLLDRRAAGKSFRLTGAQCRLA